MGPFAGEDIASIVEGLFGNDITRTHMVKNATTKPYLKSSSAFMYALGGQISNLVPQIGPPSVAGIAQGEGSDPTNP